MKNGANNHNVDRPIKLKKKNLLKFKRLHYFLYFTFEESGLINKNKHTAPLMDNYMLLLSSKKISYLFEVVVSGPITRLSKPT